MKKVLIIATKEFKTAFKDKIFLIITALFIILSIISVYIGSSTKNAEMIAYNNVINLLKSQGATTFPPSPDIFPLVILSNIITYVSMIGAVLAIFFGFDAFSGERENGTLKLILSRPIYRDQLITGKLLGGGMAIGSLLIITFVINIVLFSIVSGIFPNINEIGRLFVFIMTAFIYMMTFLIITIFVSMKTRDRAFGFLTMMIVWVFISFVIPQFAQTQRDFAFALNSAGQTVTNIPTDTMISRIIDVFSPAVQFSHIGNDLLQVSSSTASLSAFDVIAKNMYSYFFMILPAFILFIASYVLVRKEDII